MAPILGTPKVVGPCITPGQAPKTSALASPIQGSSSQGAGASASVYSSEGQQPSRLRGSRLHEKTGPKAMVSACRWARAHDCLVYWFTRTQAKRWEKSWMFLLFCLFVEKTTSPPAMVFSTKKQNQVQDFPQDYVQRNRPQW